MKDQHEYLKLNLATSSALVILFLVWHIEILLYISVFVGFITVAIPSWGRAFATYWSKFTKLIGNSLSFIVLTFIYYFFLVPMSFISKPFRKDSLFLKRREDTYFINREHTFTKKDVQNPW